MDIIKDWQKIRFHFNRSFRSSLHVSIASVDTENNPTITPIGSLFLNNDQTGFYFEKFPSKLPLHAKVNNNVCILAVNSSRWFWLKSLLKGRFENYPALKLYGKLDEKREATEIESNRLEGRMRMTNKMDMVRELSFSRVEKINLKDMTKGL